VTLSKNTNHNKISSLVFGLTFSISPLYSFNLRFTTYNITVSIAILSSAVSMYYLVNFFSSSKKQYLFFSFVCVFIAIAIYQAFVSYYLTAILLIVLARMLDDKDIKICQSIKELIIIGLLLIIAVVLYEVLMAVVYHYVPKSPYLESFYAWGTGVHSIFKNFVYFFDNFYHDSFNFLLLISLIPLVILFIINILKKIFV
jgi:hypothetical protein